MSLKSPIPPFDLESEEDVRIAVARYFAELGFDPDEMRFEDSFKITLGRNTLVVRKGADDYTGSLTGRSDMLLVQNGEPLAIVETKRPGHGITTDDRNQAISYARLLEQIAPLAIVTNGAELKVYDVYTGQQLEESLKESTWWRGEIPSVDQDFVYEAARKLVGVNFSTLMKFSSKQRQVRMADLRGSVYERKRYVPELYEPRRAVEEAFERFLTSDSPCFAVVGESGLGKTNVLCALAERYGEQVPVLFYWAARLQKGVTDAITNDFVWEFSRERHIAYVIERFDAIATAHEVPIVICIDALDEHPSPTKQLRAELLEFVPHLVGRRVKLCLSCKAFDWEQFVLDEGSTYNSLAKAVFPKRDEVHKPRELAQPQGQIVGTWLPPFNERELEGSWDRYRDAYDLDGDLIGETRRECHHPILLRLLAETYSGSGQDIPDKLSHYELFRNYWKRRLANIDSEQRHYAEEILCRAAEAMITGDTAELDERTFRNSLPFQSPLADAAYESVLRLHLLERHGDDMFGTQLAFPFESLRSFVIAVPSRQWQHCTEYQDILQQFRALISASLGREAVNFFLSVVDRGASDLLSYVARSDVDLFLNLIHDQSLQSPATAVLSSEEQGQLIRDRLIQFATTYSTVIHTHFPNLTDRFDPCTNQEVGLLVDWPFCAFRPITADHSETVLYLPDDVSLMKLVEQAPHVFRELRYGEVTNRHSADLLESLPQKVAWTVVTEQVRNLLSERFLNESYAPHILQEKVYHLLFEKPNGWVEGSPRGRYWEHLGYDTADDLYAAPVTDLHDRVGELIEHFASALSSADTASRWYELSLRDLFHLSFDLEQLAQNQGYLNPPDFQRSELFSYLQTGTYNQTIEQLEIFVPRVVESYLAMIAHNFPTLTDSFSMYKHRDAQLVVEISRPSFQDSQSAILQVLYLLIPSLRSNGTVPVFFSPWEESLAQISPLHVRSAGNLFTTGEVRVNVQGETITDKNAVFNRVRFPNHMPVTDQVYQLMVNEAGNVFGAALDRWTTLFLSSLYPKGEGVAFRYLIRRWWGK